MKEACGNVADEASPQPHCQPCRGSPRLALCTQHPTWTSLPKITKQPAIGNCLWNYPGEREKESALVYAFRF